MNSSRPEWLSRSQSLYPEETLHNIPDRGGHCQLRWPMASRPAPGSQAGRLAPPPRLRPFGIRNKRADSSDRRLPAGVSRIDGREGHLMSITAEQPFRLDDQNHLRPRLAGAALPIEPIRIEPEEDLAVDEAVPLGRRQADQTALQRPCRHRPLVPDLNPAGQFGMIPAMLFISIPFIPRQTLQIEERRSTQKPMPLDGRPIGRLGKMVNVRGEPQRAPLPCFGWKVQVSHTLSGLNGYPT